jgi:hypothetical protein
MQNARPGFKNLSWEESVGKGIGETKVKELIHNQNYSCWKKKQRWKCVRTYRGEISMVVGKDIGMEDIMNLMGKALTSHFVRKQLLEGGLNWWLK